MVIPRFGLCQLFSLTSYKEPQLDGNWGVYLPLLWNCQVFVVMLIHRRARPSRSGYWHVGNRSIHHVWARRYGYGYRGCCLPSFVSPALSSPLEHG